MKRDPREVSGRRSYLGIFFRCCRVYQRIYRRPGGDRYVGFCPHCLRRVEVPVAPGGSEERIFQAE
jgi:hypothetical protein